MGCKAPSLYAFIKSKLTSLLSNEGRNRGAETFIADPSLAKHADKDHLTSDAAGIRAYYNAHGNKLERWWKTGSDERHHHTFTVLKDLVAIKQIDRVLELGCGNGITAKYMWDHLTKDISSVDISDELIASAKNMCRACISSRQT